MFGFGYVYTMSQLDNMMSKKKSKGHAPQKYLPDGQEVRDISFKNLLLLGFEPLDLERKHAIPFNRFVLKYPSLL